MAVLTMKESKFGAPEGLYVGRFDGIQPMKDDGEVRLGRDGKPMAPGMEWQFTITEGPHAGQIVSRITSKEPTKLNACGELLRGLVGRSNIEPGEEIDPDHFIGRKYQIRVKVSKFNMDRTQVTEIIPIGGAGAGSPRLPSAEPPRPPAPPAPPRPPATAAAAVQRYWVQRGEGDPELLPTNEIQKWLEEAKVPPETVAAMPEDQAGGWTTLKEVGFKDVIPW